LKGVVLVHDTELLRAGMKVGGIHLGLPELEVVVECNLLDLAAMLVSPQDNCLHAVQKVVVGSHQMEAVEMKGVGNFLRFVDIHLEGVFHNHLDLMYLSVSTSRVQRKVLPAELLLVRVTDKVREEQGFLAVGRKILVAGRVVGAAVTCWDSCLGEVGHYLDRLHTEILPADRILNFEDSGCRVHHTSGYLVRDILVDRTGK
jgi:hypothetical protein